MFCFGETELEKKWIILIIWPILAGIFWIGNIYYPHTYVEKAFYTAVALTIIHIVFKFILEQQIAKQI